MRVWLVVLLFVSCIVASAQGLEERKNLVQTLTRIADPVLNALSKNQLRATMPVESNGKNREECAHLEAFGRLLAGMAPWLELGADDTEEGRLRARYITLARACLANAVNPSSPDFMNFNKGRQPLVDAAFLAQALLRAPKQLWQPLDASVKKQVIDALVSSRVIKPNYSNWLMFSAEIETAIQKFAGQGDMMRIDYALKQHQLWYKGDGVYGDGPSFHFDYYNSFVIQPMLLESAVTDTMTRAGKSSYETIVARAQRYAEVQERLISPEATFPAVGRSLAYRFGAFQLLSKIALMHKLPADVKPQQVRAALYAVIKRQVEMAGTFDSKGWLQIGFAGKQKNIGEDYISTGSLYLCSQAFLILGLPSSDPFWQGADLPWTQKKAWSGEDFPIDHAIEN